MATHGTINGDVVRPVGEFSPHDVGAQRHREDGRGPGEREDLAEATGAGLSDSPETRSLVSVVPIAFAMGFVVMWSRADRGSRHYVAAIWMRFPQVSSSTAVVTGPISVGCWVKARRVP